MEKDDLDEEIKRKTEIREGNLKESELNYKLKIVENSIKIKVSEIIDELDKLKDTEPSLTDKIDKFKAIIKKIMVDEYPIESSTKTIRKMERIQTGIKELGKKVKTKTGIMIIIGIVIIIAAIITVIKLYDHYHFIEKKHPNEKLKIKNGELSRE